MHSNQSFLASHPKLFMVMLTMMSVCGLIASDIFLPALPAIREHFGTTPSQTQSMLSVFLAGLACMQLLYGPVSDGIGRRRLLLTGMAVFAGASIAITCVQRFEDVLTLRIVQAIGASAGITLGRAIVGDIYNKEDAGKIFLAIFPVVGMSPAIAPMLGGFLLDEFGWQADFLFTAGFALTLIIFVLLFLPETRQMSGLTTFLSLRQVARNYARLCRNSKFWHYAGIPCFAYAAYFAYIAESPFLLEEQGLPRNAIGFSYITLSITYVAGNLVARALMKNRSLDRTLDIGYLIFFSGGIAFLASTVLMPTSFVWSIGAISILTFGNGFLLPLGTAGAVTSDSELSGSASGLMGFLQLASAALSAQLVGIFSQHKPELFGVILAALAGVGFLWHNMRVSWWTVTNR